RPLPALRRRIRGPGRHSRPGDAEPDVRPSYHRRRPGRPLAANPDRRGRGPERCLMRCDLTGKVSLVTGAARGIGQAIADRLAANGSQVVYTDVNLADVQAAAARIPGARARALDVTRTD